MIHPDAIEIWHDVDISVQAEHACSPRLKHQEISFRVSAEEQSAGHSLTEAEQERSTLLHISVLILAPPPSLVQQVTHSRSNSDLCHREKDKMTRKYFTSLRLLQI